MLQKFFGVRSSRRQVPNLSPAPPPAPKAEERLRSSALKIVHTGGVVEYYYMAIPASRIIDKYPSFVLASPDVFWRPWDAVVPPEKILVPGQKFFIVPHRTVKKLRRRIQKPGGETTSNSFVLEPSSDVSGEIISHKERDFSSKSFEKKSDVSTISSICTSKTKGKVNVQNRCVQFVGIESKSDSISISIERKGNLEEKKNGLRNELGRRKGVVRNAETWQPKLPVVNEGHGCDE